MDDDKTLFNHITALVAEEQRLQNEAASGGTALARIRQIEVELDQCWDLLRQRRAKREFGDDPNSAQVRDPKTVEGYIG